jgi:DNA-directed RNA polymerase subunit K/omega
MMIQERGAEEYTKYERARLIGARALQISQGAPILVTLSEEDLQQLKFNPVEIAKREFEAGVLPLAVKR